MFGMFPKASYLGYDWYNKTFNPKLSCVVLENDPQASCMLSKLSTSKLYFQPRYTFYLHAGALVALTTI